MKYKVGNWVKVIKKGDVNEGKIGEIEQIWTDGDINVDFEGITYDYCYRESDLEPAPKTWQTLEVGDVIVSSDDKESKILAVLGDVFLISHTRDFSEIWGWLTTSEAQKLGWKIKGVEEVVEMTVEQISKAIGKTIKVVE